MTSEIELIRAKAETNWRELDALLRKQQRSLYLPRDPAKARQARYRLLRLRQWSVKYCVPFDEVVTVLVEFWSKYRPGWNNGKTAGLRVSLLCGRVSEDVLSKEIARRYPDGDNYRSMQQRRMMRLLLRPIPGHWSEDDPSEAVEAYTEWARKERNNLNEELAKAGGSRRRNFRRLS